MEADGQANVPQQRTPSRYRPNKREFPAEMEKDGEEEGGNADYIALPISALQMLLLVVFGLPRIWENHQTRAVKWGTCKRWHGGALRMEDQPTTAERSMT